MMPHSMAGAVAGGDCSLRRVDVVVHTSVAACAAAPGGAAAGAQPGCPPAQLQCPHPACKGESIPSAIAYKTPQGEFNNWTNFFGTCKFTYHWIKLQHYIALHNACCLWLPETQR